MLLSRLAMVLCVWKGSVCFCLLNGPDWIGLDWIAGSGVFCACEVKRYVESWKFDICMVEVLPCWYLILDTERDIAT
jgi:hypothetical protein